MSVAALLATPREIERLTGVTLRAQWPAWFVALPFVIGNLHLRQSGTVLLWAALHATNRARSAVPVAAGELSAEAVVEQAQSVHITRLRSRLSRRLR